MNLSHGIDAIQDVRLYVKDVAEAVLMMFGVDTSNWCQGALGEASEFMSFQSHFEVEMLSALGIGL